MRTLLCSLFVGVFALTPAIGSGETRGQIEFLYTEIVPIDSQYLVNATMALAPNPRLEELVNAGITVPFVAEFVLTRPRWYWFDETIVERTMEFKLSYHALTRQYRLSTGTTHPSFDSYDEALSSMLALHNWAVVDRSRLRGGESYNASLRFRLDLAQLPKPFQVAALGNRDLDISTGWANWTFLSAPTETSPMQHK
ncbi:MAG TPA: DUF4390 domain-containing protein [Rhodocyclaceae bacterium]|nr:DUF4390 domain-containing protein [Rhodocyclaceae bacterium]